MKTVAVVTVGAVAAEVLAEIELCLGRHFGLESQRLAPLGEPEFAWEPARQQYSVIAIMRELLRFCPPQAVRLLALTEKDLFIPMLSFVFGQAQLNGTLAIVSLARLRQEFYQLPANPSLLLARACKETVHEMGHTFGLTHCLERKCPMSLSTTIQQVDGKGENFCANCTIVLRESLQLLRSPDMLRTEEQP